MAEKLPFGIRYTRAVNFLMALLNLFMSLAIVVIVYRGVERAKAEGRESVDPVFFIFFAVVVLAALLTPALLLL